MFTMVFTKNEVRTFPITRQFLGDKKINDIIYGFFLINSRLSSEHLRYCVKSEATASAIIKYFSSLDIIEFPSERTVRNVINLFKEMNLIEERIIDGKKAYYLPDLDKGEFVYLKTKTLEYLVDTANKNVIKIYAFLKLKQQQHDNLHFTEPYRFSENKLLEIIGYGINNSDNYAMIRNILNSLQNEGLINCHQEWTTIANTKTQYFVLDKVNEDFTDCFKHRTKANVTETTPVFIAGVADTPEIQPGEFHF